MTKQLPDGIALRQLHEADIPDQADRLIWIWGQSKPDSDRAHRKQLILQHSGSPGFRCFVADNQGVIVGFTYGLHSGQGTGGSARPGQVRSIGSHDLIAEKVNAGLLPSAWLDALDIGELQVLQENRGHGIGEALIRALCDGLPSGQVVLTVEDDAEAAISLYQKLGFDVLFRALPPLLPPTWLTVMGRTLPLPRT
jgi:ribosomal protein S18 acetylase RimI-like enzyme